MEHYNSLNVLPFYEDLKYQNGEKWYAYGSVFPLISRNDAVIPFQLIVQDDIASVISFSVVDAKSGSEVYSELTKPEIINKFSSLGYSVIKLKETAFPGSYTLKSGTYYLILKLQGSSKQYTYYSEVFVACDSVENYLKITYWNDDNIYYTGGEINYEADFKFVCYIQATIGKPEYDFEEELTKRGGYPFLESQISSKIYKFKFIAPEFLCDGLRLVRLSDYIQISENGRNYNALTFAYEPEWQAQGDLASVEAEFTVDNIIQKIASFNRRLKESFYGALLVDVNTPLGFDDESIAQYYKSYIQGSGVSNLVNGLLIRELEELKEYKDNYYAVLDTGEGAAKKILLSNLLAGIGENIDTSNFVTTDATEQNVIGVKNFNAGITIGSSKIKAYEKDGCLFIDGNLALTGGLTMYSAGTQGVGSIYDGLPIDNDTIYWEVVDGSKVLKAKGGGGEAGSVQWGNISGKPTWIGDTKPTYNWSEIQGEKPFYTKEEIAKKYVTIDTEQEISGLKHFTHGFSVGKSKKKIYEEEGVVYIDADVAVTGGVTMYAIDPVSASTIMDGVVVDGTTIKKENNVLKAVAGAGSSFDENAMWSALASSSDKQINKSHLTTALTDYATETWVTEKGYITSSALNGYATESWVTSKNYAVKATTLAGYGITDAYTKTESDNKYPTKTGSGASGTWRINVTGNAGSATKLQTARSLWGNNFDGTANISGDITLAVGKGIYLSANDERWLLQTKRSDNTQINGIKTNGFQMCTYFGDTKTMQFNNDRIYSDVDFRAQKDLYINGIRLHKTADGVITLEGNLAVTGGITTYAIDPVSVSTVMDGVVVDGTTIKKENGKLVAVGGGEAGNVAWDNVSGKPSVFPTNIANITDLHSSWDSVLAAQKPAWLTAVSIATISDLHANWDALLKAAPSAYVTRWPTISEVAGKQNLIVKLNGGTTEGTNQFTYNATGAKTINITPAGIGAYTKSESDSKYPTKNGSGASGTWRINISGNASNADKLDGLHADSFLRTKSQYGYYGIIFPGGSDDSFVRTPIGGIIPYSSAVKSSLGTSQWKFGEAYIETIISTTAKASNWFRSTGDTGWTNESYGGGWYMTDSNWIRSYNNKGIYTGGKIESAISVTAKIFYGELNGNASSATQLKNTWNVWGQPFNGTAPVSGDMTGVGNIRASGNIYSDGVINAYAYSGNTIRIECDSNGIKQDARSSEINCYTSYLSLQWDTSKDLICCKGGGKVGIGTTTPSAKLHVVGDILATGGGTYYGSDIRYKSIMQQVELSLLDIAKAPSFVYRWNKEGMKRDRLNLGGSAQYTQSVLPWAVEENDNFLSMDYATVAYTFAVHTARHLLTYETRTDKKIKKLENRVKYLEKQLKKLGYEEVRTLDDQSV